VAREEDFVHASGQVGAIPALPAAAEWGADDMESARNRHAHASGADGNVAWAVDWCDSGRLGKSRLVATELILLRNGQRHTDLHPVITSFPETDYMNQSTPHDIRSTQEKQLAVLIDADNAQPSVLEAVLQELAGYGEASVRRIYGDFTSPSSAGWKTFLNQQTIRPIQQFAYTKGKNATDCAMIIDAMDLLHSGRFDGFCLVTSDSDFTGLAVRIREHGLRVYGIGEKKTPEAFRNACHKFIFTENLRTPVAGDNASEKTGESVPAVTGAENEPIQELPIDLIITALEQTSDDSGWSHLGTFGASLGKLKPDFDSRTYGHKKLSDLVKARTDIFSIEVRQKDLYVRSNTPEVKSVPGQ
jgi:hypothetical protein